MVDNDIAVMASPVDGEIIANVTSSGDMKDKGLPGHDYPRPTFAEALFATDVPRHYCVSIQESGLELFDIISHAENAVHGDVGSCAVQMN